MITQGERFTARAMCVGMAAVAEHPVGQDMAVAIPQILLCVYMFNFELNYLEKILTLLDIRTSIVLNPPYLHFDPSSATVWPRACS